MQKFKTFLLFSIFLIVCIALSRDALAHRDDYINETFVFKTLDKGEFEPEYTLDFHKSKSTFEIEF